MNASVGCKTGWQVRSFFSSSCGSFWRLFEILFVPNCWVSPLAQPQSCRTPDDRYSIYIEFVLCLTWMGPNYYVCWLTIKHNHKSVGAPCSWSTVCGEVPVDGHLKVSPRFRLQEGECRASSRKGGVRVIEQPERQKYILSNVPSSWFLQKHCVSQLHDKLSKQKAGKRKQASRFKLCYRDKTTHFCKELKKKNTTKTRNLEFTFENQADNPNKNWCLLDDTSYSQKLDLVVSLEIRALLSQSGESMRNVLWWHSTSPSYFINSGSKASALKEKTSPSKTRQSHSDSEIACVLPFLLTEKRNFFPDCTIHKLTHKRSAHFWSG